MTDQDRAKMQAAAIRCLRKADTSLARSGLLNPPKYMRRAAAKMYHAIECWEQEEAMRKLAEAFKPQGPRS